MARENWENQVNFQKKFPESGQIQYKLASLPALLF
jgi:hypothetical protein